MHPVVFPESIKFTKSINPTTKVEIIFLKYFYLFQINFRHEINGRRVLAKNLTTDKNCLAHVHVLFSCRGVLLDLSKPGSVQPHGGVDYHVVQQESRMMAETDIF